MEGKQASAWLSPWSRGRPGWHIECSVMLGKYIWKRGRASHKQGGGGCGPLHICHLASLLILKYLIKLNIALLKCLFIVRYTHTGVLILIPHHNNEIAQVEIRSISLFYLLPIYSNYNFSLRLVTNLINGLVTFYTLVIWLSRVAKCQILWRTLLQSKFEKTLNVWS